MITLPKVLVDNSKTGWDRRPLLTGALVMAAIPVNIPAHGSSPVQSASPKPKTIVSVLSGQKQSRM